MSYDPHQGCYSASGGEFDWLKQPRAGRPTAVMGAFDEVAGAFFRHCLNSGYHIPKELAIAGSVSSAARTEFGFQTGAQRPMHR